MTAFIYADTTASISELKKNPSATVRSGAGFPVAVLNRNKPEFYCIPSELYERMLEYIDDNELISLVKERQNEPLVDIDLEKFL